VRLFCGGRTAGKGVLVLGGDDAVGFGRVPQGKESSGFSKGGGLVRCREGKVAGRQRLERS